MKPLTINSVMEARNIEFIIGAIVSQTSNQTVIQGRCGDSLIKIGDTFKIAYRYPPYETFDDFGTPREPTDERQVLLRVEKIYAYQYSLDELHVGTTAELELLGEGGDLLREDDILSVP